MVSVCQPVFSACKPVAVSHKGKLLLHCSPSAARCSHSSAAAEKWRCGYAAFSGNAPDAQTSAATVASTETRGKSAEGKSRGAEDKNKNTETKSTEVRSTESSSGADGTPSPDGKAKSSGRETASQTAESSIPPAATSSVFQLNRLHVALFSFIFIGGALVAAITLQFTADMEFSIALTTVLRRVAKSVAFRQLVVIGVAILLVRYCLDGALKALSELSSVKIEWDKTKLYYILREVYQPLELLLLVAAICTLGDTFVPSLISVPKATVSRVVRTIMSTSFILGISSVVFNLKSRFCQENAWQAEMMGDITQQRRWEAYDKLGAFIIYVMSFVLAIQAIGLEVTSVLAIGGIGGLAIGLAGREICENLLNGFLIMSTNPFEEGDEIHFFHTNKVVEGYVTNIGWYRTQIRSFEREVFVIPNSVFSKNIVLNITRKNREFRFHEDLLIRVQDVQKANTIIQDIRRIVRNDTRIINKLHRRIFLDKITREECRIYMSFYLEAANRDAFMAIKQDMLLAFVDVVERNGAKLATPRTLVEMDKDVAEAIGSFNPLVAGMAAAQSMAQAQQGLGRSQALQLSDGSSDLQAAAAAASTLIPAEVTITTVSSKASGSAASSSGAAAAAAASPAGTQAAAAAGSSARAADGAGSSSSLAAAAAAAPPPASAAALASVAGGAAVVPMSTSPVVVSPMSNNVLPSNNVSPRYTHMQQDRTATTRPALVSSGPLGDVLMASFEDIGGVYDSGSFGSTADTIDSDELVPQVHRDNAG